MKKFIIFAVVGLLLLTPAVAEESKLIDFNDLIDDFQGQHQASLVDFSSVAGTRYTEEEKAQMRTSLYIPNWGVELSSSSRTTMNDTFSLVKAVTVNETSTSFAGEQVMGVRVHFPLGKFNSYAWVKPPFRIPAYATSTVEENPVRGDQFANYGVVKNVGIIKTLKANVYGMNYPMGLSIVLRGDNQETQEVPLGYLDFDGWKELSWQNPNYITEVRNRELITSPLYPRTAPSVTLDSLQFYRDALFEGGDFISYVKDIVITYDLALIQDIDSDLNHESVWGILENRESSRRDTELQRLGNLQVLRYIETQKMHQDTEAIPAE